MSSGYINLAKLYSTGQPQYIMTIPNIEVLNYDKNSPLSPYPLPEFDSDEQIIIKLEGNSTPIGLTFTIHNNGANWFTKYEANGTLSNPQPETKNIFQIWRFLDTIFNPVSLTDRYELTIGYVDNNDQDSIHWKGGISKIHLELHGLSPINLMCHVDFLQGNIVALWDEDTPSAPQNIVVSSPASGQLKVNWIAPKIAGASPISEYIIEYAAGNNQYTKTSVNGSTFTKTIPGLGAGIYSVRVFAVNNQGAGRKGIGNIQAVV
jgi:hypothetical protein